MCIHNISKQYEQAIELVKKSKISAKNKQLILSFKDDMILENLTKSL